MNRKPKELESQLRVRRELGEKIMPHSTAYEKEAYRAERKKQEEFDERQKDPKRLNEFWMEFAEKDGIMPENLTIGSVPDEDELDLKADEWLKKEITERERHEPIYDVKRNDDGTFRLTINPSCPKDLIFNELGKLLDPSPNDRFREESLKALDVYDKHIKEGNKPLYRIASELNIPYSTAKTRWRRAYFLIYQTAHDPHKVKSVSRLKADELCAKCKDVKCYNKSSFKNGSVMDMIPCADYLRLAGKSYQREKTMTEKQMRYTQFGEVGDSDD